MSRDGKVAISCWDGDYTFRLAYGEIIQLEELCDVGAWHLVGDLRKAIQDQEQSNLRAKHVRELFRLALVGGGMSQGDALKCVRLHVEPHLNANVFLAFSILLQALEGTHDETLEGKGTGAEMKASSSQEENPPSQSSTATVQ